MQINIELGNYVLHVPPQGKPKFARGRVVGVWAGESTDEKGKPLTDEMGAVRVALDLKVMTEDGKIEWAPLAECVLTAPPG